MVEQGHIEGINNPNNEFTQSEAEVFKKTMVGQMKAEFVKTLMIAERAVQTCSSTLPVNFTRKS